MPEPTAGGPASLGTGGKPGGGRIARWIYSNKNLAGCGLALAAPVLAVAGLVAPPVALALVPVLYAAGALAAPGTREVDLVSGVDARDVRKSLRLIQSSVTGSVNKAVAARVDNICQLIESLLPRVGAAGDSGEERFVLVRTATDYLPRTLEPYLRLPRMYADHKIVSDGKTATQVLCEQLDVMFRQLEDIGDAIAQSDTDRLLANGRFLSERFGQRGLGLPGDGGAERGAETP